MKYSTIDTEELQYILDKPEYKLIDIRSADAYNGWQMNNESRSGHIRNAKSLPYKWFKYIDWVEIVRKKEICQDHSLVIYGTDESQMQKAAEQFIRAGYGNVRIYPHFISGWCNSKDLDMEKLPRFNSLVPADWVKSLIDGSTENIDKYVICHAFYRNRSIYEEGHIPGALALDTNSLESTKTWNRRTSEEIEKTLLDMGITHDTTVILYGRFSYPDNNDPFPGSSAGQLAAMRCAFIMMYAGVKDVRLLNGGFQSWLDKGYLVSDKDCFASPEYEFGSVIPQRPEVAVDIGQAKDILEDDNSNLVSVRSWNEFIGKVSGYNYIEKKGRIPGAVFGSCGSDAYHMENYRNPDHTCREYQEIEVMWEKAGIVPDKHNSFYCGTGWRGSEAFMNAWFMGWDDISVYDGGWFEWSSDNTNPCETGVPV